MMQNHFWFEYDGRIVGSRVKAPAVAGGRQGPAICYGLMLDDQGDYLVVRPIDDQGRALPGAFIDVPAIPDVLDRIGAAFLDAAMVCARR